MKTALFRRIMEYLKGKKHIEFELFEHKPVYTSTTASGVFGS